MSRWEAWQAGRWMRKRRSVLWAAYDDGVLHEVVGSSRRLLTASCGVELARADSHFASSRPGHWPQAKCCRACLSHVMEQR